MAAEINHPMNISRKAGGFTLRKDGQNKKLAVQVHPLPRLIRGAQSPT